MKSTLIFLLFSLFINHNCFAQTTIYLVRHAEKVKGVAKPDLTAIGKFRANNIAHMLSKSHITHVFSSNYKRTMQSAQPMAQLAGVKVELYNPSDLKTFAEKLKQLKSNALVVGHSNTTPELTALLSGKKVEPMNENEFDNVYQVILNTDENHIILNHFKTIPAVANPIKKP